MDRTLKQHLTHLEKRLGSLNAQFMENTCTQPQRIRIQREIVAAELALVYYRKALELEKKLS